MSDDDEDAFSRGYGNGGGNRYGAGGGRRRGEDRDTDFRPTQKERYLELAANKQNKKRKKEAESDKERLIALFDDGNEDPFFNKMVECIVTRSPGWNKVESCYDTRCYKKGQTDSILTRNAGDLSVLCPSCVKYIAQHGSDDQVKELPQVTTDPRVTIRPWVRHYRETLANGSKTWTPNMKVLKKAVPDA